MLASVVDLVMQPPVHGLYDTPFVRTPMPVARIPASVIDAVIRPCTYVVRWSRSLFDGFTHGRCASHARIAPMQRTGPYRLYEPPAR